MLSLLTTVFISCVALVASQNSNGWIRGDEVNDDISGPSNCGRVPRVAGAFATSLNVAVTLRNDGTKVRSDTVTYACRNGQQPSGDSTVVCQNSRWSQLPVCTANNGRPQPGGGGASANSGLTVPSNGPQCKYDVADTHALCQDNSPDLVRMQKLSISEILNRHNYWRRNVSPKARSMPDLQWDNDLATEAERHVATCVNDHDEYDDRALPARGNKAEWPVVGQNLFWSTANMSMTDAIDNWASERRNWSYGNTIDDSVGHYTQIIWAKSRFVGCGKSYCQGSSQGYYVACNYGPGGNNPDEQPYDTSL